MNLKAKLSVMTSAFAGGALGWLGTHLSSGVPSTGQQWEAFGAGVLFAGLVAVVHLYQQVPVKS